MESMRFYAPSGERLKPVYQKITKNGKKVLEQTGETDIVDFIQASADEVDILNIYARLRNGDFSPLYANDKTFYGDFSQLPKNINEFHMLQANAEKVFGELPLEVRNEFNNNYEEYVYEMQNGEAQKKLSKYLQSSTSDDKVNSSSSVNNDQNSSQSNNNVNGGINL